MRVITPLALCLSLVATAASAQIAPRQATIETMDDPSANWFMSVSDGGAYVYDGESGQMQGLLEIHSGGGADGAKPTSQQHGARQRNIHWLIFANECEIRQPADSGR